MPVGRTYVVIEVDGTQFDFFSDYDVTIDLLAPGGEFHFAASLADGGRGVRTTLDRKGLSVGRKANLRLVTPKGVTLQHTGRIYDVVYETTRKVGSVVQAVVRDHMHPVVHADAVPSTALESSTYAEAVVRVLAPFGFSRSDIVLNGDAARMLATGKPAAGTTLSSAAPVDLEAIKLDQAMPQAGESAFAFLMRHAKRFGLLVWGTADGKVVVSRPNYDQKPLYDFALRQGRKGIANNVKSARRKLSISQRPSEVHVYGKTYGGDFPTSSVHEVVYDDEVRGLGVYAPVTLHDNNARDKTQAHERGEYEIGRRKQAGDVTTLTMRGHAAADGTVYAIDTIGAVHFDVADIDSPLYLTRRAFRCARGGGGTEAVLDFVPRHSIVLGEGISGKAAK